MNKAHEYMRTRLSEICDLMSQVRKNSSLPGYPARIAGHLLCRWRPLGGSPEAFFSMKELVQAFLPVLRADYRIIGHYTPSLPISW